MPAGYLSKDHFCLCCLRLGLQSLLSFKLCGGVWRHQDGSKLNSSKELDIITIDALRSSSSSGKDMVLTKPRLFEHQ